MFARNVGREKILNCWLFVASLLITGRLRGLVIVWDSIIPHLVGVSPHGRLIHFRRTKGTPRVLSLWFNGVCEVMPGEYGSGFRGRITRIGKRERRFDADQY